MAPSSAPDGCEIFVRNLPQKATEQAFKAFLKPFILTVTHRPFHCQKPRDRNFGFITFLSGEEGDRFVARYGQPKPASSKSSAGPRAHITTNMPLQWLGKPMYCDRGNKPPNPLLLRHLATEEKARTEQAMVPYLNPSVPGQTHPKILPMSFTATSLSCGIWKYTNNRSPSYAPQLHWAEAGVAKFGPRSVILKLNSGLRMDVKYFSVLNFTAEDGNNASFIFTLTEPPHFFQAITSPLEELFEQLGLSQRAQTPRQGGPKRHRIQAFSDEHSLITGSCLVYRVTLGNGLTNIANGIQQLRKAQGIPEILTQRVDVHKGRPTYIDGFQKLKTTLESMACDLPWEIKFQVQKLAQDGYLPPNLVLSLLPEIVNMVDRSPITICVQALRKLFFQIPFASPNEEKSAFEHETFAELLKENEASAKREFLFPIQGFDDGTGSTAIIHRAKVTPSTVRLAGPEPEPNNRVLRKYYTHHEYFLRVQFCDEDGQQVFFNPHVNNEKIFRGRFKAIFDKGINIAGRIFKFLGFSHSSLRAQSCWFVAPFFHNGSLLYEWMIIRDLGDFSQIYSPAKCAARIGQTFSDTPIAVPLEKTIIKEADDVERNNRVFSDGVGTISQSLLEKIWRRLPSRHLVKPTCFQIRYCGAKGMVSLDSRLKGDVLILRPSMVKFEGSDSTDLEICQIGYKPLPFFLNRQLIKILEDMGVDDSYFLNLQARAVDRIRMATHSPGNASSFLKRQYVGNNIQLPWLVNKLSRLNLDFRRDKFLNYVLEMAILMELRVLKHKSRILVEKGYYLYGIMDETSFLEEGEVFCTVMEDGRQKVITGSKLIITRCPALHPGDVQVVNAVEVPASSPLWRLHNCICFSQKGSRDLPSKLSGGDLDGDRYYITWDEDMKPKCTYTPADYPRLPPVDIGRPVTKEDMSDFFLKFMESDQLGRIAVNHRVKADVLDDGTLHQDCLTLAELHSTAVDFSKTGIPVDLTKLPKPEKYRPDFEAPGPMVLIENKEVLFQESPRRDEDDFDEDDEFTIHRYYESDKVLGKLYRAIKEKEIMKDIQDRGMNQYISHAGSSVMESVWEHVKEKCHGFLWEHHRQFAQELRDMYEEKVQNIMYEYSEHPIRPLSELEVFVGNILGRTGAPSKRQRELSQTLKERFDEEALQIISWITKDDEEFSPEALERSIACLAVSLEEGHTNKTWRHGDHIVSFKYIAATVCLREVERLPGY